VGTTDMVHGILQHCHNSLVELMLLLQSAGLFGG
jgi:hypothetical protein